MSSDSIHPDVYAGFASSVRKDLGAMSDAREKQHVLHYAKLTALHESCHALAYALMGAELISVDILRSEGRLGYTLPNLEACTDSQIAIGCFAGCIGELLCGHIDTFVEACELDVGQAVFSCVKLCADGNPTATVDAAKLQRVIRQQWDAAVSLLLRPTAFAAIHMTAAALLARGRLAGADVLAIAAQADRPLPQLAKSFRIAKQNIIQVTPLIPDLARHRWLHPSGTRLRDGAVVMVNEAFNNT